MSERAILDSQRMFEHACTFCDCAKFCEVEPNNIEYRMLSHTLSGIVNSAFACEVFIKTLLVFHGRTVTEIKGHKLKTLWEEFRTLDNATAALVEERMREWFNSTNANMFDELLSEYCILSLCSIKSKFRGILKPFVFCREKPGKSKVSASLGCVFY